MSTQLEIGSDAGKPESDRRGEDREQQQLTRALVEPLADGRLLAQLQEVLGRARDDVLEKLHGDAVDIVAGADLDVEVHLRVGHVGGSEMRSLPDGWISGWGGRG